MLQGLERATYRGKGVWGAPRGGKVLIRNWRNQVVGPFYVQPGVFERKLGPRQFYRSIPGISMSVEVIDALEHSGCRWLLVTNRSTLEQWWVSFEEFLAKSERCIPHPDVPEHLVLRYEHWERLPKLQPQLI